MLHETRQVKLTQDANKEKNMEIFGETLYMYGTRVVAANTKPL